MRRLHPPLPHRDREVVHGLNAEPLEPLDGANDVQHGVDGADLVQMDLVRRDSVYAPLGLAHEPERAYGTFLHPIGDRRAFDEPDELTDVTAVRLLRDLEFHLLARDAGTARVANPDSDVANPEPRRQL